VLKGDLTAARAKYEKSLATATRLAEHDPADLESRVSMVKMHVALGVVAARRGFFGEARQEFGWAIKSADQVLSGRPEDVETGFVIENARQYENAVGGCSVGQPCAKIKGLRLPDPLSWGTPTASFFLSKTLLQRRSVARAGQAA
jgi:hypothetical protein